MLPSQESNAYIQNMGKESKGKSKTGKVRAPRYNWPGDLEKRFCESLESFPILWNSYEDAYTNRDLRPVALVEMGEELDMSGE